MMYLESRIAKRLEEKLQQLNELRPLPQSAVKKLHEQLKIEMTYNSNAIEGNSLTLKETYLVIQEGITVKGKPLKDHLEAKDHHAALQYLYELVETGKRHTISERLIRSLHQLIVQDTDKEWAGRYRNAGVMIGGAAHRPPDALDVPRAMSGLVRWMGTRRKKLHVVEFGALVHHKLVDVHPFFDGNGRTARLLMNLLLMQEGFPLVIILRNDRKKYYGVLGKADQGECKPLVRFIAQAAERSLDVYLKVLTPVSVKRERYASLSALARQTPYSAKYLNLLVRQGKLEAHKEGRRWMTTQEAINRYISGRARNRKVNKRK